MSWTLASRGLRPRVRTVGRLAGDVRAAGRNRIAAMLDRMLPRSAEARHRVLVIEDRVPHPHFGAGNPRSNVILRDLTELGFDVTLYPLVYPDDSQGTAHADMPAGVEVATGRGATGLRRLLTGGRGRYGVIFVSRPHNIEVLRRVLPMARRPKVIYDAEALFCMREIEQRRVEGRPWSPRIEQRVIAREIRLAAGSRCVVTVSESDRHRFVAGGFRRVVTLSHSIEAQPTQAPFDQRRDFLFVGPVDDVRTPNVVAVTWFAQEVLPRIRRQLSAEVRLIVAGHQAASVVAEAGRGVEFLGRVGDLTPIYNGARVFVAPSKFAAGIPLKVIEAAAYGLPVVGTTLMATQLGWRDGVEMLAADGADAFAAACVRLYTDQPVWNELRVNALARVERDHAPERFSRTLKLILDQAFDA